MRAVALAALFASSAVVSWAEKRSVAAADRVGPSPSARKTDVDVQKRVRELIYVLRYHRASARVEEWTGAMRELVRIGSPAVPELVAELDRTERPVTLRGLAFTLRAIGDPRAVPALIRALGKKNLEAGSDYGTYVLDPELMAFMQKHQCLAGRDKSFFLYGRPINEISAALFKLTKHQEPGGLPGWTKWWAAHSSEILSETEPRSVQLPGRDRDLVEEAGTAWFGPLFPTGKHINLGPVHEVELQFDGYVNARSYIDFDTGRLFQFQQGISADDAKSNDFSKVMHRWFRQSGVDAHCNASVTGDDLQLWVIDNSRWGTLQNEIHSGRPMNPGREATTWLEPFGKDNADVRENELGTFLFITREGGRGVVQVLPRENDETYSRRIRYRMWGEKGGQVAARPVPKVRRDESDWGPERVGILRPPGRGQVFLMNLETGQRLSPPDSLVPANAPETYSFANDKKLAAWCRAQGADLGTIQTRVAGMGDPKPGGSKALALVGLDMNALTVLPSSYGEMTLPELKELFARWSARSGYGGEPWMLLLSDPLRDTYAIVTKSGTLGLLQIKAIRDEQGGIVFRYRLAKDPSGKK